MTALIGREEELAAGTHCVLSYRQNCLVIAGEAGVGKSRLAAAVMRAAAEQGHPTARALATDVTRTIPLAALAHLLPDPSPSSDVGTLVREAAAHIGAGGRRRPAPVVLVEDVHHLDEMSVALLRGLVETEAVRLVATVRDDEDRNGLVSDFSRPGEGLYLRLGRFDEEDVSSYLSHALQGEVSDTAVTEFARLSAGNVMYLKELFVGAVRRRQFEKVASVWDITQVPTGTPRLSQVVHRRMAALGNEERDIVETLACCEFLDLSALEGTGAKESLDRLITASLVQVRRTGRRTVCALVHPVVGQVVRERLPHVRRREIYRQQVRHIKGMGARRREDVVRIATFEVAAEGETDSATLAAATRFAHEARAAHEVLELLEAVPPGFGEFDTALLRGEAACLTGNFDEAEGSLRRAEELATTDEQVLPTVMLRTWNTLFGKGTLATALRLNGNGRLKLRSPASRRTLDVNDAALRTWRDPAGRVLEDLTDAEGVATPRIRHWVLLYRSLALSLLGRTAAAADSAMLAYEVRRRARPEPDGREQAVDLSMVWLVFAHMEGGDLRRARELARRAHHLAAEHGLPGRQALHAWLVGRCELMAGRLREARTWHMKALTAAQGPERQFIGQHVWAGLTAIHAQSGDLDAARKAAARYDDLVASPADRDVLFASATATVGRAWLLHASGQPLDALHTLDQGIGDMREAEQRVNESWLLTERARLGGLTGVRDRLVELSKESDGRLVGVRARVAAAMHSRQGDELMRAALSCAETGMPLLAAETALAASHAHAARGDRDSATKASRFSAAQRRQCGDPRTPGLVVWPGTTPLTPREREIALLAVTGLTNKEIARHLVLSVRTVENLLQKVYNKTGLNSRRALVEANPHSTGPGDDRPAGRTEPLPARGGSRSVRVQPAVAGVGTLRR
ncbi:LuxR C-terminal-related transcriptional regulator [Streptomyces pimonensis]|uniref:LuxR C-terminal-related transcriptional regulator n=1 Tax=Streptomyces pimonensis TaxID=2860288 RepID=A0ABV4J759_9ACTN